MSGFNIGNWFSLRQGSTYRKFDLYIPDFTDEANLDYWKLFPAPFGGPIACIRDSTKLIPISGSSKQIIKILDNSGNLVSQISVSNLNCEERPPSLYQINLNFSILMEHC